MRMTGEHPVGLGFAIAVALLGGAVSVQAQDAAAEPVRCEVQVTDAVPVSEKPVIIEATYPVALGEALAAGLQEESGARLVSAEAGTDDQSLLLTVDTSHAVPGEWTLSLTSMTGACTGTFTVAAAETAEAAKERPAR